MFSTKTILELSETIEYFSHSEIDRIVSVFNFPRIPPAQNASKVDKTNEVFNDLRYNDREGPFSENLKLDLLQYLIDRYFKKNTYWENGDVHYSPGEGSIRLENAFSNHFKGLANSLKRDGFVVEGKTIRKLLPDEIHEAELESELMKSLKEFEFDVSKSHLQQAIDNHSSGNWAGANSQFRTFIESLLTDIANKILPDNNVKTAPSAIKLLTQTANPPFLSENLNEFIDGKKDAFMPGFWSRLNPAGSHPGLSDEEDCSFRYHMVVVVAVYLLRRFKNRP